MTAVDGYWNGEGESGILAEDLDALPGGLVAATPGSRFASDRGPAVHESQRRNFATGREAQDAAMSLHRALQIPTAQAVNATYLERMIGRVDHRFNERNGAAPVRRNHGHSPA